MVQKIIIGNSICDVHGFSHVCHNPILIDSCTAIDINDGYIYPIRNKTDTQPGAYDTGPIMFFKPPMTQEQQEAYSADHVIDFSNTDNIRDLMSKQAEFSDQERSILTTVDNVYSVDIGRNDTPHIAALKQAINDKHIDMDKYGNRFGANFNNDRRLLRRNDITMNKFMTFLEKMDLAATLTIRDAGPDVPNPMGHEITVELVETSKQPDLE